MSTSAPIKRGDHPSDVLVIGGGILGASIARDCALRQLRVLLVEQADFASGTSSRSSRLLHGGLRYLAQGRIGLVRSAQREKATLHRVAPHLCQPVPFAFPAYLGEGWPPWMLKLGMRFYDRLGQDPAFPASRPLAQDEVLAHAPGLRSERLKGGMLYYDGFTSDARLVIDTLRSAEIAGAQLSSYTRFVSAERSGPTWRCTLQDSASGENYVVENNCVINAAGPWADEIPGSRLTLRCTKGVHLVFDHNRLPVDCAVVLPRHARILFVLPWGRRTIVGTTDTDYRGPLAEPVCEPSDLRYLLDALKHFFPNAGLGPSDVLATWAGLRPLTGGAAGSPSNVSRSHLIRRSAGGWFDVAGGKLTTARLIAEEVTDRVIDHLGFRARPCTTAQRALLRRSETEGCSGVVPPDYNEDLVRHCCQKEWTRHLADLMLRRTGWHYYADDAPGLAEKSAGVMAEALGWSAERLRTEIDAYQRYCAAPKSAP